MDWTAAWLTLKLAFWTTFWLLILGLPLAWWLATTRWRFKFIVEAIVALPIILPPTVIGFYVLWGLGPHSPLGRGFESLTGATIPFTFTGILIGSIIYNLPFAVRPFIAGISSVDRDLVEAAWVFGHSRLRAFVRVTIPLAFSGVATGIVLTFAHTIGEFGVVLMIGGSIPGVTRTISIAIYDDVQALDYAAAHQTAIVLVALSFAILCGLYALQRKVLPL